MQNTSTGVDYLLHVGSYATSTSDFLTVHNDGYVGIGKYNPGNSLTEISDVAGLGSAMPLFLIDNGTPTNPYFVVDGSSGGINVGIGIDPGISHATLAMKGIAATELFLQSSSDVDYDNDIGFSNSSGTIRHFIGDNYTSGMLTIVPGLFAGKSVVNIQGSLLISNSPGDLFTPSTTTDLSNTYGLIVDRGILTEMVKVAVKTTADWSDYLFDNNYQLPTFSALETYIKTNKHLPDVPSAEQVVCDVGIDVAKMDARLMQKIEELNLYVIQLEKENKKQDEVIAELLKRTKTN